MDLKKPLTYDEQIIKLENHGLIITDKIFAKKVLSTLNYYRILFCIHTYSCIGHIEL